MGNLSTTTPVPKPAAASYTKESACPVTGFRKQPLDEASGSANQSASADSAAAAGCPVQKYKHPHVYNVYSQRIDPTNQMPVVAEQKPIQAQKSSLSSERQKSSIPKAGTDDETWVYPSPQMFWNALVRKNKTEAATERDMEAVIAVHNNMNEKTWRQVLEWEKLHGRASDSEGSTGSGNGAAVAGTEPKLLRFLGRPDDLSPKARLKMLFGAPKPFDRHDWVVDRGGREVRYVIDYYHDESAVEQDARPTDNLRDFHSMKSIIVDVRPALDSPLALLDRLLLMPYWQVTNKTQFQAPSFFPPKKMISAAEQKANQINQHWATIQKRCAEKQATLALCGSDDACGKATVALQQCIAGVVCPETAQAFEACVNHKPQQQQQQQQQQQGEQQQKEHSMEKISVAFDEMVQCVELFEVESREVLQKKRTKMQR